MWRSNWVSVIVRSPQVSCCSCAIKKGKEFVDTLHLLLLHFQANAPFFVSAMCFSGDWSGKAEPVPSPWQHRLDRYTSKLGNTRLDNSIKAATCLLYGQGTTVCFWAWLPSLLCTATEKRTFEEEYGLGESSSVPRPWFGHSVTVRCKPWYSQRFYKIFLWLSIMTACLVRG